MSVPVAAAGHTFTYGNPRMLFEGPYVPEETNPTGARSYALAPDGKRLLMMKEERSSQASQIVVILNWGEELKRIAARAGK